MTDPRERPAGVPRRLGSGAFQPLARLRRVGGVLRATIRERGPWWTLPEAIATAALAPVCRSVEASSPPPRDLSPERAAAAARIEAARGRIAARPSHDLRVAAIADAADLAALSTAARVTAVRPEDWAIELEAARAAGAAPDLLLVTSARSGNGGAWTYRIGWYAHPDSFLHRDLRALVGWCAEHGIPSLFVARDTPDETREFGDAAALFDLIVTDGDGAAAAFGALPARRGIGARSHPSAADLAALVAGLRGVFVPDAAPGTP